MILPSSNFLYLNYLLVVVGGYSYVQHSCITNNVYNVISVVLLQITGLFLSRDVVTIIPLLLNPHSLFTYPCIRVETMRLLRYRVL